MEAVTRLRCEKASGICIPPGICNINVEMLIAGSAVIPPNYRRGLVVPIWKEKGDRQDCNNCARRGVCPSIAYADLWPVAEASEA